MVLQAKSVGYVHMFPLAQSLHTQTHKNMPPKLVGILDTGHHFTFQGLSDFFKTSETLKAIRKEKWIQARCVSTTVLTATSSETIDLELLTVVGFDPEKAHAIVLPDTETMSESWNSVLDSDQEPARTGDPKDTTAVYTQSCPEAMDADQAGNKCCLDLTEPSNSLPTLIITWALHLPIDDSKMDWLDHFLTNMDILNDVYLKHQQCGVGQDAPKV